MVHLYIDKREYVGDGGATRGGGGGGLSWAALAAASKHSCAGGSGSDPTTRANSGTSKAKGAYISDGGTSDSGSNSNSAGTGAGTNAAAAAAGACAGAGAGSLPSQDRSVWPPLQASLDTASTGTDGWRLTRP